MPEKDDNLEDVWSGIQANFLSEQAKPRRKADIKQKRPTSTSFNDLTGTARYCSRAWIRHCLYSFALYEQLPFHG